MSLNFRSTAAAFALVLVTTTAAQALPLSFEARGGESFLATAWEWLTSFFLPNELSTNLSKEGGMMDPNGAKAGGMMDPNGFPTGSDGLTSLAGSWGEEGGMMDPNGLR